MAYALNINKGTEIIHPDLGLLEAGVAVRIPDDLVDIAKSLRGIVVFDRVAGINENKVKTTPYQKDVKTIKKELDETEPVEKLKYTDFVKKYKDVKLASEKWEEYKKKTGIK